MIPRTASQASTPAPERKPITKATITTSTSDVRLATTDVSTWLQSSADLVIGCVLVAGASAPKLIRREDLKLMKKGAVLVDVAIDQGGCFETSRATTHAEPTYVVDGVVHYCVANMPGAAPLTSTYALVASTTPYVLALADKGMERAFAEDPGFAAGLNIAGGRIVHPAVAASQNLPPVAA